MNLLAEVKKLENEYHSLRHGKSKANEDGIIVSDPEIGINGYGLVGIGRGEVRHSIVQAVGDGILDESVIIVASPFKRTKGTARITRAATGAKSPIIYTPRLYERNFGEFEGKSNKHYQNVWNADVMHLDDLYNGVESVESVQCRTTMLIRELEQQFQGKKIVLVSHGDALQILETGFRKVSPRLHRQIPHLQTAELRKLQLAA